MRTRRAVVVLLTLLLVAAGLQLAPSSARADDPTWAEVQQAKHDANAKARAVGRIQRALDGLEQEAARLGTIAVRRAAVSEQAASRLRSAQATVDRLDAQVASARDRAAAARRSAGAVATQLYRAGDPTLSVWLSGERAGSLLNRLSALQQIGESSSALLDGARIEQRQADALAREAAAGAAVRDALAQRATATANRAGAAASAARDRVEATSRRRATLTAQLRSLQSASRSLQDSYRAAQAAKRAAAERGDTGGGGALSGIAPGPGSLSPAAAQSYAADRLGDHGWDGSQLSCLVRLWNIESGWRWNAYNASSGAYGIPQSLPGAKMAASGGDWTTSARTQIDWGLGYIRARYATPCAAYAFETSHVPYWY